MSHHPLFFRYSYIIDGSGSIKNRYFKVTVHGLYFGFWHVEPFHIRTVQEKAQEWFKLLTPSWWTEIEEGEEEERVPSHEAKGLGFYIGEILVNDKRVQTFHLRHRFFLRDIFVGVIDKIGRLIS